MAEVSATFTPPAASPTTELYYAVVEDTGLIQVFGNQSIPVITSPPETITYRTLESTTEFAVPGVTPYEGIEIENLYYKEQYTALKTLADANTELFWYVKLPDTTVASGEPMVIKWKGAFRINLAEIALDDMLRTTLTIYKSTKPAEISGLPTGG